MSSKPVICCILDGWGHRDASDHNAIAAANTPNWDQLLSTYANGYLHASEDQVGLPGGQMGNSEVGHMNIGAGRILLQDLPKIDDAIARDTLRANATLTDFIDTLKSSGGACHLMGLLSDGGVHAHQNHMLALARIVAEHGIQVYIHAFLDGRDTPPQSAGGYLADWLEQTQKDDRISVATLCGRYYAMDRDQRWDRVQKAYAMLVDATGAVASDANAAILSAYEIQQTTDEFVEPCIIQGYPGMRDGDGLLMANFRADRAREILHALLDPAFDGFVRAHTVSFAATAGMVEYSNALSAFIPALFPPEIVAKSIGEVVSNRGLKQLRIAETEKYAHVTFFMNGGREEPFDGEARILVPSPDVATYDLKPEMSAAEVTDKLVEAIKADAYDLIIVNYANTDMVGHSGNFDAAIKAVEAVDACLGRLHEAVREQGGAMLVTADHGNAELMHDAVSNQPHTAHTLNVVPLVLVHPECHAGMPVREGRLADIAPTLLQWMGIAKPEEMTGESLLPDPAQANAAHG